MCIIIRLDHRKTLKYTNFYIITVNWNVFLSNDYNR